jgi:hypothetical protein
MALLMSLNESIAGIAPGVGMLLGGASAALLGPRAALAIAGGGSLVIAAATWMLLPLAERPVDDLTEQPTIEPLIAGVAATGRLDATPEVSSDGAQQ